MNEQNRLDLINFQLYDLLNILPYQYNPNIYDMMQHIRLNGAIILQKPQPTNNFSSQFYEMFL